MSAPPHSSSSSFTGFHSPSAFYRTVPVSAAAAPSTTAVHSSSPLDTMPTGAHGLGASRPANTSSSSSSSIEPSLRPERRPTRAHGSPPPPPPPMSSQQQQQQVHAHVPSTMRCDTNNTSAEPPAVADPHGADGWYGAVHPLTSGSGASSSTSSAADSVTSSQYLNAIQHDLEEIIHLQQHQLRARTEHLDGRPFTVDRRTGQPPTRAIAAPQHEPPSLHKVRSSRPPGEMHTSGGEGIPVPASVQLHSIDAVKEALMRESGGVALAPPPPISMPPPAPPLHHHGTAATNASSANPFAAAAAAAAAVEEMGDTSLVLLPHRQTYTAGHGEESAAHAAANPTATRAKAAAAPLLPDLPPPPPSSSPIPASLVEYHAYLMQLEHQQRQHYEVLRRQHKQREAKEQRTSPQHNATTANGRGESRGDGATPPRQRLHAPTDRRKDTNGNAGDGSGGKRGSDNSSAQRAADRRDRSPPLAMMLEAIRDRRGDHALYTAWDDDDEDNADGDAEGVGADTHGIDMNEYPRVELRGHALPQHQHNHHQQQQDSKKTRGKRTEAQVEAMGRHSTSATRQQQQQQQQRTPNRHSSQRRRTPQSAQRTAAAAAAIAARVPDMIPGPAAASQQQQQLRSQSRKATVTLFDAQHEQHLQAKLRARARDPARETVPDAYIDAVDFHHPYLHQQQPGAENATPGHSHSSLQLPHTPPPAIVKPSHASTPPRHYVTYVPVAQANDHHGEGSNPAAAAAAAVRGGSVGDGAVEEGEDAVAHLVDVSPIKPVGPPSVPHHSHHSTAAEAYEDHLEWKAEPAGAATPSLPSAVPAATMTAGAATAAAPPSSSPVEAFADALLMDSAGGGGGVSVTAAALAAMQLPAVKALANTTRSAVTGKTAATTTATTVVAGGGGSGGTAVVHEPIAFSISNAGLVVPLQSTQRISQEHYPALPSTPAAAAAGARDAPSSSFASSPPGRPQGLDTTAMGTPGVADTDPVSDTEGGHVYRRDEAVSRLHHPHRREGVPEPQPWRVTRCRTPPAAAAVTEGGASANWIRGKEAGVAAAAVVDGRGRSGPAQQHFLYRRHHHHHRRSVEGVSSMVPEHGTGTPRSSRYRNHSSGNSRRQQRQIGVRSWSAKHEGDHHVPAREGRGKRGIPYAASDSDDNDAGDANNRRDVKEQQQQRTGVPRRCSPQQQQRREVGQGVLIETGHVAPRRLHDDSYRREAATAATVSRSPAAHWEGAAEGRRGDSATRQRNDYDHRHGRPVTDNARHSKGRRSQNSPRNDAAAAAAAAANRTEHTPSRNAQAAPTATSDRVHAPPHRRFPTLPTPSAAAVWRDVKRMWSASPAPPQPFAAAYRYHSRTSALNRSRSVDVSSAEAAAAVTTTTAAAAAAQRTADKTTMEKAVAEDERKDAAERLIRDTRTPDATTHDAAVRVETRADADADAAAAAAGVPEGEWPSAAAAARVVGGEVEGEEDTPQRTKTSAALRRPQQQQQQRRQRPPYPAAVPLFCMTDSLIGAALRDVVPVCRARQREVAREVERRRYQLTSASLL